MPLGVWLETSALRACAAASGAGDGASNGDGCESEKTLWALRGSDRGPESASSKSDSPDEFERGGKEKERPAWRGTSFPPTFVPIVAKPWSEPAASCLASRVGTAAVTGGAPLVGAARLS